MGSRMTFATQSDYVKPCLAGVAVVMVVLGCWLAADRTGQRLDRRKLTRSQTPLDGHSCEHSFRMSPPSSVSGGLTLHGSSILLDTIATDQFTLWCLLIAPYPNLLERFSMGSSFVGCANDSALFTVSINGLAQSATGSTPAAIAGRCTFLLTKVSDQLSLFALGAALRYDLLRHGVLLSRTSCSGPSRAHTRLGPLILGTTITEVNKEHRTA